MQKIAHNCRHSTLPIQCTYDCQCRRILKADLDGTTFAYDCRMRFIERALLASCKKLHTTLVIQYCLYLRLSICDIYDSRKRVVGLIYTKQFVS